MRENESQDETLNDRDKEQIGMMNAEEERKSSMFFQKKQYIRENQSEKIEFRLKGQSITYSGVFYNYQNNSVHLAEMIISETQIGHYIPTVFDSLQEAFKYCILAQQFQVKPESISLFYYLHRPDSQISGHKTRKQIKLSPTKQNLTREQQLEMMVNKLKQNRSHQLSLKSDQTDEICQELLHLFRNVQNKYSECFSKEIDSNFNMISKNHDFLRKPLRYIVISNQDLACIKNGKEKNVLELQEKVRIPKICTPYRLFKEIQTEKFWNIGKCWAIQTKIPEQTIHELQLNLKQQLLSEKNRQGTVVMPYGCISNINQLFIRRQQIWIFTEKGKYFSS